MKHIYFLLFFLLFASTLSSQKNFKAGYFTTHDEEKKYGLIDFSTSSENAKKCRFKEKEKGQVQVFLPDDISGYSFLADNKHYVSKKVQIDGKEEYLFLELLLKGIMDLYYYSDNGDVYYFFEKEDGSVQVVSKEEERIENGKYINDKQYDGLLRNMFYEYLPSIYQNRLIDFDRKSVVNIVKTYHDNICQTGEDCIIYLDEKPNAVSLGWDFSVYGGLNNIQYIDKRIRAINMGIVEEYKMSSYSPSIGVQANVFFPRASKSFSLQLDMFFSKFNAKRQKVSPERDGEINLYMLSPRLGVKYMYTKSKLRPFCEIGLVYTKLFNPKIHYYYSNNSEIIEFDRKMKRYFFKMYVAAGVNYKLQKNNSLFVSLSYDFLNPTEDVGQDRGTNILKMAGIKVGYTFTQR